jgi:hypothetical protein
MDGHAFAVCFVDIDIYMMRIICQRKHIHKVLFCPINFHTHTQNEKLEEAQNGIF